MEILPGVHLVDGVVWPGPAGDNPVNVGLLVEGNVITLVDAGPAPSWPADDSGPRRGKLPEEPQGKEI